MTRLKGPSPPIVMALDVLLNPIVSVGIKQDRWDKVTLFVFGCDTLVVVQDVEATTKLEGVVLYGELIPEVGYIWKVAWMW